MTRQNSEKKTYLKSRTLPINKKTKIKYMLVYLFITRKFKF